MAALVAAFFVAAPADAQTLCGPRADIVAQLDARYGETPRAVGIDAQGRLVELFATAAGTSWTMLRSWPDGRSCLIAAGQSWQILVRPKGPQV
jgi:hypothetical protein